MAVDYSKLREQTLGSGLDEEAVTVNTRALIDKVLARYSGEWTTLRELIQNAADASATKVTIRFETLPSSTVPTLQTTESALQLGHVLQHHTLKRMLVSNNGQAFGENDWARLKRIAEGNPDETKIGAFGVGFYSVFADCENPFVSSGDQTMAFFWKGNSLFTRRGNMAGQNVTSDTCFLLDYRSTTSPIPSLISLCQFLSTSLTFVGLESIELWVDQWNLLTLSKKSAPPVSVRIPSDVNPKTKDGLMKITAVESQNAQIDAKWMNAMAWDRKQQKASDATTAEPIQSVQSLRSFFTRFTSSSSSAGTTAARKAAKEEESLQAAVINDLTGHSSATVFLRVSTARIQTNCSKTLAAELERATKKPPPKQTRIAILTSSYDESSASLSSASGSSSQKAAEIFASVLPTKNGRIFIGFPTAQTTGLLAHISAPSVIPTVERESIDLNARYVRSWNHEMLRVAGIACRVAYIGEMDDLKSKLERQLTKSGNKNPDKSDIDAVSPAAVHAFRQYTFQESTPSSQVGQIIEEAFWTCNQKASIDILSTRGVLPSVNVRMATEDLSFVSGIPVVPDKISSDASAFLSKLQEYGLLTAMTTQDIKRELEAQAISETQLIELLKWASRKMGSEELDSNAINMLFDGTVVTLAETAEVYGSPVLLLGNIAFFPTATRIPAELPMPTETIPFKFIKTLPKADLESFGWTEIQIVPWLRYIIEKDGSSLSEKHSITGSASFAGQVLPVVSKSWEALSQSSKTTVIELLATRTVIPTKLGMRKPGQAYFSSVRLFDDLPTIHGLNSVKEKFLLAIGVRKTVDLGVVFERLMTKPENGQETKWSHIDLIKYLVSVRADIPDEDINKLRKTPICPREMAGHEKLQALYRVSELFEPKAPLRDLALPLLAWPDFRLGSPEAAFLGTLGLRQFPSVPDLVDIMVKAAATGDEKRYESSLLYLISNWHPNQYRRFPIADIETRFLPVHDKPLSELSAPSGCFSNQACAVLGFPILRQDLNAQAAILGVGPDPPIAKACERLLRNPPKTKSDAKIIFGYFSGRLNEIGPSGAIAARLSTSPIIPVKSKGSDVKMMAPDECFLGSSDTYGDIFDFVDFGPEANSFLLSIGSKYEPSAVELARRMVKEPVRFSTTLGTEKYLILLRKLAESAGTLKADKTLWANMKRASCLIGDRWVSSASATDAKVLDEDDIDDRDGMGIKETVLAPASELILIDDFPSYRIFRDKLVVAPQEKVLEDFYSSLGANWLRSLVNVEQSMGPQLKDQSVAISMRKRIIERCRLFLYDHAADVVRHDARWLEETLQVKVTEWLKMTRTLKGFNVTHTDKMTAALHRDTKKDAVLFITDKPDLFDVSRTLMPLLLRRHKQQDLLALETIMESSLQRLKIKGYNVDRILRLKAAEARVAEAERQKQLQEEQNRLAEEERAWKQAQEGQKALPAPAPAPVAAAAKEASMPDRTTKKMPGSFDASPEPATKGASGTGKKKSVISSFVDQLLQSGYRDAERAQTPAQAHQLASALENGEAPPPYSSNPATGNEEPNRATPAHQVQQNLVSAIQASRAHGSDTIFSPPRTATVKEQASYCDDTPGHDLAYVGSTRAGIKLYLPQKTEAGQRTQFLQKYSIPLNAFAILLKDVGGVFLLDPQTLHIYNYDAGNSIAFNLKGSLFFNFRYFLELHWGQFGTLEGRKDAAVYWWVTLCHELAHNLHKEHSSKHGFVTESFVSQYFPKIVARTAQWT